MYSKFAQRCLSLLMALAMVLSLTPLQALATETEASAPTETEGTPSEAIETSVSAPEPVTPEAVQARINALLDFFGITGDMADEEIAYAIAIVDGNTLKAAMNEIEAIDLQGQTLSDDDLQLLDIEIMEAYDRLCYVLSQLMIPMLLTEATVLNGQIYIKDDQTRLSESNGTVTVTANGDKGFQDQRKTNTITITNKTGSTATISFDYTISNSDKFTIEGKTYTANDSYTVTLDANEYITLTLKGKHGGWFGSSPGDAVLTLKNFRIVIAAEKSNVTFKFDNTKGSVTVNGAGIDPDDVEEVELNTGAALVATSNSGVTFLGWINAETGFILSTAASFTLKPMEDMIVKAVFVTTASDVGWFLASGGTYLFDDLTKANTHANSAGDKTIILANNGTLSGTHEISSGVTLLIPFNASATLCREAPNTSDASSLTKPTPFRTLTLAEGASISVDGELSISGTQHSAMAVGTPFGPVGFIQMQSGSNITINNGGKLYAWGYITGTGSGSVTVKSGGTVYECFQVSDWRGGSATSSMSSAKEKIFPITQYYLQNVEVPMRLEAGASEYGFMSVDVTLVGIQTTLVPFVGPNAMFRITSGAIIKDYIESEDRLAIDLDSAELSISPLTLSIKASLLGTVTLNSANFVLPLASNMTLNINTGSKVELSQDIAFLPGTEVNIAEGAFCTVTGDSNIYVYDVEAWGDYCGAANKKLTTIAYAPGQQKVRTENDLVDAAIKVNGTVDATKGYLYTTSVPDENGNITGGANIYSEGAGKLIQRAGTNKVTYQATYVKDGYTPHKIPIIPAKLKHEDGTYLDTSSATTATTYNHDHYTCLDHGDTAMDSTIATCGKWVAGEHTIDTAVVLPTYQKTGKTATCTCDHGGDVLPKVVQQAAIAASADSEIILDVKFWLPDTVTSVSVVQQCLENKVLTTAEQEYTVANITKDSKATGAYIDGNGRYVFSRAVASGEMTCPITFTFKDENGNVVQHRSGEVFSDSLERTVVDYAKLVLENGSNTQKALINSLAVYGGYSQKYFGKTESGEALFDEAELAHNILGIAAPDDFSSINKDTITQTRIESTNMSELATITQNAFLDSSITLRVFFTATGEKNLKESKFVLHRPVNGKDAYTENLTPQPVSDTKYYVDITDIPSGYLDHMYRITIDGTYEVKTSVLAYLKSLLEKSTDEDQMNAARAMYLYSIEASNFFQK